MSQDRMLTRIGGLLRQAESTDNPHEAEAFMEAAQRLATAASIDLAVARSHASGGQSRSGPVQRTVEIGERGKRGLKTYVRLFVAIAAANDVTCDVLSTSTQVYAYGFASDIDTTQALYASLVVQMVRASDAYISSGAYRDATVDRVVRPGYGRARVERKPLAAVTARIEFQSAFADRIGARLAAVKAEITADAVAASDATTGTALALRDKDLALTDFYRSTSTARGRWRGNAAPTSFSRAARRAGDHAGRRARLGTDAELGSPRGAIDR
ncbi:DUF2786 domain-containing protein [Rhodococcoides corynebacterioides]|uniref:DUF2786 domain-containing protein n=1 Tax=Rhodococcoides corynebacterioides TaxID=53972 RepID=UPI00082EAE1C|nr:DUF2786 domain-containing protein [Rhodococcus corynebacterioides]